MKYHINKATGAVGKCSATKVACPFGGEEDHYSNHAEAKAASEESLALSFTDLRL